MSLEGNKKKRSKVGVSLSLSEKGRKGGEEGREERGSNSHRAGWGSNRRGRRVDEVSELEKKGCLGWEGRMEIGGTH